MTRKLSKAKAEVWDRLQNGIQPLVDFDSSFEDMIAKYASKQITTELDKEIIQTIITAYTAQNKR